MTKESTPPTRIWIAQLSLVAKDNAKINTFLSCISKRDDLGEVYLGVKTLDLAVGHERVDQRLVAPCLKTADEQVIFRANFGRARHFSARLLSTSRRPFSRQTMNLGEATCQPDSH
jgi:hypothetical protein